MRFFYASAQSCRNLKIERYAATLVGLGELHDHGNVPYVLPIYPIRAHSTILAYHAADAGIRPRVARRLSDGRRPQSTNISIS